jgi:hypothetical protein
MTCVLNLYFVIWPVTDVTKAVDVEGIELG